MNDRRIKQKDKIMENNNKNYNGSRATLIIELPDYKKIAQRTKRRKIEVTPQEIDLTLEAIRKSRPKMSQVLREAKIGDFVEIEFWATSPPLPKEGDGFLLGSGKLIPGFEDQIAGMTPGQEKEFILQIPSNHHKKELAGKEVKFKVVLKQVQKIEFPELTDDFAKSLGKFENLEHLRRSVKEGLGLEKEAKESQRVREEILTLILEESKLEIPEALLEKEKERRLQELKTMIANHFKISFEDYLKNIGKSQEVLQAELRGSVRKRLAFFLILTQIARRENISVSQEELNQEVQKYLNQRHFKDAKEAQEKINLEHLKTHLQEMLIQQKVLELLEGWAQKE